MVLREERGFGRLGVVSFLCYSVLNGSGMLVSVICMVNDYWSFFFSFYLVVFFLRFNLFVLCGGIVRREGDRVLFFRVVRFGLRFYFRC